MLIDLTVKPMSSITASASTLKSISSSSIFGRQKSKLESFSLSFHKWALIGLLHDHLYAQETKPNRRMKTKQNKTKTKPKKPGRDQQYLVCCHAYVTLSPRSLTSLLVFSNFFSINVLYVRIGVQFESNSWVVKIRRLIEPFRVISVKIQDELFQ